MTLRLALAAGVAALALACGSTHPTPPREAPLPKQTLRVAKVTEVVAQARDEIVGTVRARNATAISASIMGTVRALKVGLGSQVRAGDVLVQLAAGEIEANVEQARAVLERANIDLRRAKELLAKNAIASSAFDAAAAQQRIAETALATAEVMRGYTLIRSPIAGVVTQKQTELGDLALPGKPLLVIESLGALRLEAAVPEAVAYAVRRGAIMSVRVDALDRVLDAKVSELSPSAEAESRSVLVKLDLPQDPELRPGMFGRLFLPGSEARALMVPASAVVPRGQMEIAYVVKNGSAQLRIVRTGKHRAGEVELLAGLEPGEIVVAEHPERLVDGQPIDGSAR